MENFSRPLEDSIASRNVFSKAVERPAPLVRVPRLLYGPRELEEDDESRREVDEGLMIVFLWLCLMALFFVGACTHVKEFFRTRTNWRVCTRERYYFEDNALALSAFT